MGPRRVEVLGGGPAGLFAARLIKGRNPECEVRVTERSVPDDTFGFGVAFTARTLKAVAVADRPTFDALIRASVAMPAQEIRINGRSAFSRGGGDGIAIARSALLEILLAAAEGAGVSVDLGRERSLDELCDADLVVGADGVASTVREQLSSELGSGVRYGRGVFIWLGLADRLSSNLFAPAFTEHGMFNIHGYPYASDRSTIGVEADFETFRAAGMAESTDRTKSDDSDEYTIDYLQAAFADVLGGARILGNRSRWMRFPTVSLDRWHHENVVLIGDAAHTAHYSVGSGTKMALEDAIGLADALNELDVPDALVQYERLRRPRVSALQDRAIRSQWWWESLRDRVHRLEPAQMMLAYLSRGGAVSAARLVDHDQALLREGLASFAGVAPGEVDSSDPSRWALGRPYRAGSWNTPSRLVGNGVPDVPAGVEWLKVDDATEGVLRQGRAGDALYIEVEDVDVLAQVCATYPGACVSVVVATTIHDPWSEEADELVERCSRFRRGGAAGVRLEGPSDRPAVLDRLALAERIRLHAGLVTVVAGPAETLDDLADGVIAERTDLVAVVGTLKDGA
jgi:anthraniloyl-CoA monooxygenase